MICTYIASTGVVDQILQKPRLRAGSGTMAFRHGDSIPRHEVEMLHKKHSSLRDAGNPMIQVEGAVHLGRSSGGSLQVKPRRLQLNPLLGTAALMSSFAWNLPVAIAASQTLQDFSESGRADYYACAALLSWWGGIWLLLWVSELHWRYDWYCLLQRVKFVGGSLICTAAGISFLSVVFGTSGSHSVPQISVTVSTFLVWLAAGGCGVWVNTATVRHACALTLELAKPRYRIAIRRHFPSVTSTLLAASGKSSEVQVVKAHVPLRYALSGWSYNLPQWWSQQWQYQWNGHVFWDHSNKELYVVMKSAQERLGRDSASTLSKDVVQSNALEVARTRVQCMLARLPNVVWQAKVCRALLTMLLESHDVRAGAQSNNGDMCGVKWEDLGAAFKEGTTYSVNLRTLTNVCLLALWEEAHVFSKLQRFIDLTYAALPKEVAEWNEDDYTDKVRESALGILFTLQGSV